MNSNAPHISLIKLHFSSMQACSEFQTQELDCFDHGQRTMYRASRPIERRQKAITEHLNLIATKAL